MDLHAQRKRQGLSRGQNHLPDELLLHILSFLFLSRDIASCSLVSKRWRRLTTLVSHLILDPPTSATSAAAQQEGLLRWFGNGSRSNLRSVILGRSATCFLLEPLPQVDDGRRFSLGWLEVIGTNLRSLTIGGTVQPEGFWTSISACQQIRCLHIHFALERLTPESAVPVPRLLNLRFCYIVRGVHLSTVQQLLAAWTSLIYIHVPRLLLPSCASTHRLSSPSLDCLYLCATPSGFSLDLDMPKLRWMIVNRVQSLQLSHSTCNVEWLWLRRCMPLKSVRGLCLSKLTTLTIDGTSFDSAAQFMDTLAPIVTSPASIAGITSLHIVMPKHFQCRSISLAALLEPFHGLEVLDLNPATLRVLNHEGWSTRHAPLRMRLHTELKTPASQRCIAIEFMRELLSKSCLTLLEVSGLTFQQLPHDCQPCFPVALHELADSFPGRVKLHPFKLNMPQFWSFTWHMLKEKMDSDKLYTDIHHSCSVWDLRAMCAM